MIGHSRKRVLASLQSQMAALGEQLAALEKVVAAQTETIEAQAGEITSLQEAGERQEEEAKQLRGDLAQIRHQAALDLDEMRQTNIALANSMLLKRSSDEVAATDGTRNS